MEQPSASANSFFLLIFLLKPKQSAVVKRNWPLDLIKLPRDAATHSKYLFKEKTKVLG